MSVKLRLQRVGTKKKPFYRIVAVDSRVRRDGASIEQVGIYQPINEGEQFVVDEEKAIKWLKSGAQPTNTILQMFKKSGLWNRYQTAK